MSTQPVVRDYDEQGVPLTRDAAYEMIMSLYGCFHDTYEALGGVDKVIQDMDEEEEISVDSPLP